jgi:hypothetical protein
MRSCFGAAKFCNTTTKKDSNGLKLSTGYEEEEGFAVNKAHILSQRIYKVSQIFKKNWENKQKGVKNHLLGVKYLNRSKGTGGDGVGKGDGGVWPECGKSTPWWW